MKNFKWFMIIAVSICFIIGIVSLGWSAEKVMKPGVTAPVTKVVIPHCPTGYTLAPDGSKCTRNKPATPCASGFHVEWGTCITGTGLGAHDPWPCGYKCIPNAPAAGSYAIKCGLHFGPPIVAGPCEIRCTEILY